MTYTKQEVTEALDIIFLKLLKESKTRQANGSVWDSDGEKGYQLGLAEFNLDVREQLEKEKQ